MTNADDIIKSLEEKVEKGIPMSPSWYLEQAQSLVIIMGDETDLLHKIQKEVANMKVNYRKEFKSSVADANIAIQATDLYEQMLNQKSKCERIVEIIRIAKIQSRMKENDMFSGNL